MKVVAQRVLEASCTVDGTLISKIEKGLCLLVGFEEDDNEQILEKMAAKIAKLRIFDDGNGHMNLSVMDIGGSALSISQFTLYANCRKGNRPSFTDACNPEKAKRLYECFNEILATYVPTATGIFQADMKIALINDGPVTIVLNNKELGF